MRLIALVLDAQGLPVNGGGLHTGDHVYRWLKNLSPGQTVLLDCGVGGLSPQGLPDAQSRILYLMFLPTYLPVRQIRRVRK